MVLCVEKHVPIFAAAKINDIRFYMQIRDGNTAMFKIRHRLKIADFLRAL